MEVCFPSDSLYVGRRHFVHMSGGDLHLGLSSRGFLTHKKAFIRAARLKISFKVD